METNNSIGNCLVSYDNNYIEIEDNDEIFNGHSSKWESKQIALIFSELGYNVDVINWGDSKFVPEKHYDVVFDIHQNLARLAPFCLSKTIKILHSTGSYPEYAAHRELDRIDQLIERKKKYYLPKRVCETVCFRRSSEVAHAISLFGTEHTKSTFPKQFQDKITLLPVSYSQTVQKDLNLPLGDEFLWFYGEGAVHKGLDILLDIFSKNHNYKLNVVGNIESENDFMQIYHHELMDLPNIMYHGYLDPLSVEFNQIIEKSFAFIAPSCSESTSTAAVTCLIAGLYPIYSIDNGLTLPENTGYLLNSCSHVEILKAVKLVSGFSENKIKNEVVTIKDCINIRHSRNNFTEQMRFFLKTALQSKD